MSALDAALLVRADTPAPNYCECLLTAVFPAGAQRGTSVVVRITGASRDLNERPIPGGLKGARELVIDGPPGIVVRQLENVSDQVVHATLDIAPDAVPGRRMIRIKSDRAGLTSGRFFTVGTLPECLEAGDNNSPDRAQTVTLPTVVNGAIEAKLDVDCYRFQAQAGQKLVAAIAAHDLDVHSQPNIERGFADATLELLDERGRVVAEASDTIGLDPLIEFTVPADGWYTARVCLASFEGFPESSYRLTLGEVAYPTAIFPGGGRRGQPVEVEFRGPNVAPGTRATIHIPGDNRYPLEHVALAGATTGTHDVAFHPGDLPELLEQEPNSGRLQATQIPLSATVNGEFAAPHDEDWYWLALPAGQRVRVGLIAQRFLRSPIDTIVEVYGSDGRLIAENDDAAVSDVEFVHDFDPFDSGLVFAADAAGDYFVRVREQSGLSGPQAVYRLTVEKQEDDFRLLQWPDAVPIWGPGSTAALMIAIEREGALAKTDVAISIEGLPAGWLGSTAIAPAGVDLGRVFLTITVPRDARIGDMTEFRVVGRATVEGTTLERQAQPFTIYLPFDRMYGRLSRTARAVVAEPQGPWLETDLKEAVVAPGGRLEVPVRVCGDGPNDAINLSGNRPGSIACGLGAPTQFLPVDGLVRVPLKFDQFQPGTYGITISRSWAGDIRKGLPGPCTPLILVRVAAEGTVAASK